MVRGVETRARGIVVAAAVLAAGAGLVSPPATASDHMEGPILFEADGLPSRPYHLFVPAAAPEGPMPLVVALHGCNQNAVDFDLGARLNAAAADRGMAVVYPEQVPFQDGGFDDGNNSLCWNWFRDEHQHAGAGEPGTIAAITRQVVDTLTADGRPVDARRISVMGVSAGADMATIMAATHPDLFAAVGVLSGCAYATCADVSGALAYEEMRTAVPAPGTLDPMPAFIAQGSTDMVNNAALDQSALRQWLGTNDLIDDGSPGSVSHVPDEVVEPQPVGAEPGSGDPCLPPYPNGRPRLPCAGGVLGLESYPYSVERYEVDEGGTALVEHWLVHGLNHAIPNGDTAAGWTDPLGPDLTGPLLDFFLAHPKPVSEVATSLAFTESSATAGQFTDEATLEVRLTDASGAPLAGHDVTVDLAGEPVTATTGASGVATATFELRAAPGVHDLTASFAGGDFYLPSDQ